jgi:hypothetical protein
MQALKGRHTDSVSALLRPFRATKHAITTVPRALPWAVLFQPIWACDTVPSIATACRAMPCMTSEGKSNPPKATQPCIALMTRIKPKSGPALFVGGVQNLQGAMQSIFLAGLAEVEARPGGPMARLDMTTISLTPLGEPIIDSRALSRWG